MNIKRSLIGFFMLTMMVLFSGCIRKSDDYIFDCQTLNETVNGIEIFYINEKSKEQEQLYVLEENEIPNFLEEFCELTFEQTIPPRNPIYYAIKLLYQDGSFDLISAHGGYSCNKEGEIETYAPFCKGDSWDSYYNLLLKYIEIDKYDVGWNIISNKYIGFIEEKL